jgi:hypothetical protein
VNVQYFSHSPAKSFMVARSGPPEFIYFLVILSEAKDLILIRHRLANLLNPVESRIDVVEHTC